MPLTREYLLQLIGLLLLLILVLVYAVPRVSSAFRSTLMESTVKAEKVKVSL
jgi:flagellar biogenesis protein FliO